MSRLALSCIAVVTSLVAVKFPTEAVLLPNVGETFLGARVMVCRVEAKQFSVFDHALLETKEIVATRIDSLTHAGGLGGGIRSFGRDGCEALRVAVVTIRR